MDTNNNLTPMQRKRRNQKRRNRIIFFVLLVLIVLGFIVWKFVPASFFTKTEKKDLPPIKVTREESRNQIEIAGYIEAAQQQILESPGEGMVQIVNVKEGQSVKKGTLIFSLDATEQKYKLASQEFAMKQEQVNGASQKLKLMQQQYEMLKKQLSDRNVIAQFDGIIASLKVSQGRYAKPKDDFGILIDRSYLKASVEIAESDASRLKVGQKVKLNFAAEPSLEVEGVVASYPSIARVTSMGRTVLDADIHIKNPPKEILPGYSFNGNVVVGEDSFVLALNQAGIRYEEGKPFVDKILENGQIESIQIVVEPYVNGFVKVTEGLFEGDTVKNQMSKNMRY